MSFWSFALQAGASCTVWDPTVESHCQIGKRGSSLHPQGGMAMEGTVHKSQVVLQSEQKHWLAEALYKSINKSID